MEVVVYIQIICFNKLGNLSSVLVLRQMARLCVNLASFTITTIIGVQQWRSSLLCRGKLTSFNNNKGWMNSR